MDLLHPLLAVLCGALVGFTLGLIGGGGSIMATPLLLYVVGLQPHVAIGTGALAVSVNAFANFGGHARSGNVLWRCAVIFAVIGVAGAAFGSMLGKQIDGKQLLLLFVILMIVVGVLMLRRKDKGTQAGGAISPASTRNVCQLWNPKTRNPLPVASAALGVGALSGFFGIGGGFLIVPDLLFSTGMPMICAICSSLLAVGAFGLTTRRQLWNVRFDREGGGGNITVPILVYLIEHPKGRALFDTGLHPDCQGDPAGRLGERMARLFRIGFAPGEEISARLEAMDRDPRKIDIVINSHLHFDHVGGNALIPNATMLVQRREWDARMDPDLAHQHGFNPRDFAAGAVSLTEAAADGAVRPKLLAVLPHDRCGRFKPNADAAALVDISALGGNSTDDILGGQYRCHVAATLTGRLPAMQLLVLIVSRPQACNLPA